MKVRGLTTEWSEQHQAWVIYDNDLEVPAPLANKKGNVLKFIDQHDAIEFVLDNLNIPCDTLLNGRKI